RRASPLQPGGASARPSARAGRAIATDLEAAGASALDPLIIGRMLGRRRSGSQLDELTPREREVLAAMAEGKSQ
ncbi:MAG: hypothetical protein ACRDK0_05070, partial [Solirubrobacteraceae bacterium]